jgi:hypothetical protein
MYCLKFDFIGLLNLAITYSSIFFQLLSVANRENKKTGLFRNRFFKYNRGLVSHNNQVLASAPEISVVKDNKFVN